MYVCARDRTRGGRECCGFFGLYLSNTHCLIFRRRWTALSLSILAVGRRRWWKDNGKRQRGGHHHPVQAKYTRKSERNVWNGGARQRHQEAGKKSSVLSELLLGQKDLNKLKDMYLSLFNRSTEFDRVKEFTSQNFSCQWSGTCFSAITNRSPSSTMVQGSCGCISFLK